MNLFSAQSPFVRHLLGVLSRLGKASDPVIKHDGRELLYVSYFPEAPHGIPVFDFQTGAWDAWCERDAHYNLMLCADDQHRLWLHPGDDGGQLMTIELRSADELPELLEFITTAEAAKLNRPKWVTKPLSALLDGAFQLIASNGQMSLQSLWPDGAKSHESIAARDTDLVLGWDGTVSTLGKYLHEQDSYFSESPHLLLRLRNDVSGMFFADYLAHALEASAVLADLLTDWSTVATKVKGITVDLPSTKRDQTARSVELRTAKLAYRDRVRSLLAEREPLAQIVSLYRKRIRSVNSIHDELLDEIMTLNSPLPFFIEYPYKRFRRADDPLLKLKYGQSALTLLTKIPLFLVTEELAQSGWKSVELVLGKLRERPLSDGSLLELRRELDALLKAEPEPPLLPVFASLAKSLVPGRELELLVKARNRFHHPPYEETGFRQALEATLPNLVEGLRQTLEGIRFLIPKNCQFRDDQRLITACNVCSSDTEFPMITISTRAAFESFPVDALVAYNAQTAATVRLKTLITYRRATAESLDFGVFDRMKGDKPEFDFLRSVG